MTRSILDLRLLPLVLLAALAALAAVVIGGSGNSATAQVPGGFQDSVVISGLDSPSTIAFAPGGQVFVAEKSGRILVFDSLADTTPTLFADLSTNVYNNWDRGLLALALHPDFPAQPYVYVAYTHDAVIGGTAPRWGTPGVLSDPCPDPPGPNADGCVTSGRLSRLQATPQGSAFVMTGSEQVFIEDWGIQYTTHSIGDIEFGPDGMLYVSGGDGASFTFVDWGQDGNPINPLGDPPGPPGTALTPPTAEGGALRTQDLRTSGDPVTLDGTIARVDPLTGLPPGNNPLIGNPDQKARYIVAYGMRNPFRFAIRPGTNEIWTGDVGWDVWEELNRITDPVGAPVENLGWPCYEGFGRQPGYDAANLNICENLYAEGAGAVVAPYFTFSHFDQVVPGEACPTGSSSVSGVAFYEGGPYPDQYDGALFLADFSRSCIWAMFPGANGLPDPSNIQTFVDGPVGAVDLAIGPNGDLFYVSIVDGTIHRVSFFSDNQPPHAVLGASPTSGPAPLTVNFDATGSSDPDFGDSLTYEWDLDGDGQFDDSTAAQPSFEYTSSGNVTVRLRVTDEGGLTDTASRQITAGNSPPTAIIESPSPSLTWQVGQQITFAGRGTDPQQGNLPAGALSWELILHHCSNSSCHVHELQDLVGTAGGSFIAPDHEQESYIELRLTATDAGGLKDSTSVDIFPVAVTVHFDSSPQGLTLGVGSSSGPAPFDRMMIVGSTHSVSAPSPQTLGPDGYDFSSWSDGGAQSHNVTIPASPSTFTATFVPSASSAAALSSLAIAPGSLSPAFNPSTTSYSASVGNGVTSVDVTAAPDDDGATFTINGQPASAGVATNVALNVGANAIPVVVTSEDGASSRTYTVTVTRAAPQPPGGGGGPPPPAGGGGGGGGANTRATLNLVRVVLSDDAPPQGAVFELLLDDEVLSTSQRVNVLLPPGTYVVSGHGPAGYEVTIGGRCDPDGTIRFVVSEVVECTVTFDNRGSDGEPGDDGEPPVVVGPPPALSIPGFFPGGVSLVVTAGEGTSEQLLLLMAEGGADVSSCTIAAFINNEHWVVFVPASRVRSVNEAWHHTFESGIPSGSLVFTRCAGP